jgi:carbonic anhydrase
MSLNKLKNGNKKFTKSFHENEKLYLDLVNNGQNPKVLWVGCSDSRVVPEFTVNANAGDLFVTRNIANIIPPSEAGDSCTSSVLEYAVLHLNVEHIIICGHTGCGGMNAVIDGTPADTKINEWLKHACHPPKESDSTNREALVLETIKANILLQSKNLLSFDYVEKKVKQGELKIHSWLYEMHIGKIMFYNEENKIWTALK